MISRRSGLIGVLAITALTIAACSSSVDDSGGTGGSSPVTTLCAGYCSALAACFEPASCVLADPEGGQSGCEQDCAASFAVLSSAETDLVAACLSCALENAPAADGCPLEAGLSACKPSCDGDAFDAAAQKQKAAFASRPLDSRELCTSGASAFHPQVCEISGGQGAGGEGGGGDAKCTIECCSGSSCATPAVGMQCDGPIGGLSTCTCTVGKNVGVTFQTADPCSVAVWDECNL